MSHAEGPRPVPAKKVPVGRRRDGKYDVWKSVDR